MKRIKLFFITLIGLLMANGALADDKQIAVDQLPAAAKAFVDANFKGKKISYAEKDRNSYECRLDDGTTIEFDRKGNWDNVETKSKKAVPEKLVPKAILQYVKANYSKCVITKIDKERYGNEIELSNGIDLKFNKKGAFIGIDR